MVEIKQLVVKSNVVAGEPPGKVRTLTREAREELVNALMAECRMLMRDLMREKKER